MILFQLAVYSCVTFTNLSGDLISKTCRWDDRGFYASEYRCRSDGDAEIGKPIFSDMYEQRNVERSHCIPVPIRE